MYIISQLEWLHQLKGKSRKTFNIIVPTESLLFYFYFLIGGKCSPPDPPTPGCAPDAVGHISEQQFYINSLVTKDANWQTTCH